MVIVVAISLLFRTYKYLLCRNDRESEERKVGSGGEETSRWWSPEIVIIDKNRVTETLPAVTRFPDPIFSASRDEDIS